MQIAENANSDVSLEEKTYQVALSMVPHVGGSIAKQLISYCGSAQEVFNSSSHLLHRIPGIGAKIADGIRGGKYLDKAREEVECCQQKKIDIYSFTEKAYPYRLKQLYDAPLIFYYKGTADLDHPRIISMVGTRKATPYGRDAIDYFIRALAEYNILVVSGLAYGIDIMAHRASLQAGMQTIGVMASGMDVIYPAVHRNDAVAMLKQGGILTEQPLGLKPDPGKFPARNRLIAGLADATLVIEAAEKGGALITANLANDYNREVFAIPGNIHQPFSKGCNALISQHKAHILNNPDDFLKMMQWENHGDSPSQSHLPEKKATDWAQYNLTEQELVIVKKLQEFSNGLMIDELSWRISSPVNRLAADLIQLEFKGLVQACPGKKFKLANSLEVL